MSATPQLGPLLVDIEGTVLSPGEREILAHPLVGGVIFFARNYSSPEQLKRLCLDIRAVRQELLLCVDQEGGRVQRFREGFTRLPAMGKVAAYVTARNLDAETAYAGLGALMAAELRAYGIDFSFAPVLDVDYQHNAVIADRAFGQSADQVTRNASAFFSGMAAAGMAGVGKHFPGHGFVHEDTHVEVAVDRRPLDLLERDLEPFKALIGGGVQAIMPAHIIYPALDGVPAVQSAVIIEDLLRQKMGFDGCVISDDLGMAGASSDESVSHRVQSAITAGCDLVMTCNNPLAVEEALECLEAMEYDLLMSEEKLRRRARMQGVAYLPERLAGQMEAARKLCLELNSCA